MSRVLIRSLLGMSVVWLVLLLACSWLLHPSVGEIASILEPNPFWSVQATGDLRAPFQVSLKVLPWLACCVLPLAGLYAIAWGLSRANRPRRQSIV